MNGHPSFDILGSESQTLAGKTIVLGITGSVACVRAADIARKLMRAGAHVRPVMTKAATGLIHPDLMEWATGYKPIVELTGAIEHVDLVGNVPVHADLMLIAPATANTVSKIACGIDDSPVTTMVTTGFGEGVPLLIVPAMHLSMYEHPIVKDNIKKLQGYGVEFLMPRLEEGKAKIPSEVDILRAVEAILAPHRPLAGYEVLVTAGRTVEYLDPIRVITNNATGKMGVAVADAALELGARVTLVYGKGSAEAKAGVTTLRADTAEDMLSTVSTAMKDACDRLGDPRGKKVIFVGAAAVGDWKPVSRADKKIGTSVDGVSNRLIVELEPTPKIIDGIRDQVPDCTIVAFRAQAAMTDEELRADGQARLTKARADFIAINDTTREGQGFETSTNALQVLDRSGTQVWIPLASKFTVARELMNLVAASFDQGR